MSVCLILVARSKPLEANEAKEDGICGHDQIIARTGSFDEAEELIDEF